MSELHKQMDVIMFEEKGSPNYINTECWLEIQSRQGHPFNDAMPTTWPLFYGIPMPPTAHAKLMALKARQVDLGPIERKILNDKRWELYE